MVTKLSCTIESWLCPKNINVEFIGKNKVLYNIDLVIRYRKIRALKREGVLREYQKQNSLPCVVTNANEPNYFNSLINKNSIAQYIV
ncbi:hypothetical protein AB674_15605 [Flavobacterium sp. ABG]|jgi:hypothetical protein|nr:hypothetical protein AB674_15605 [Flavobacterium sp. ABG]